jgi:hypothetical protein
MVNNGAFGETRHNSRAARTGEYTLHPSDIDFIEVKEYRAFPKMIYRGAGVTEADQKVVMDDGELARELRAGWRLSAVPKTPAPALTAPFDEVAVAPLKKRGRPRKDDAVLA